ncbi:hypothetical protein LZ30DRAFT_378252 [Colletotrichum cereale]|nr:hypothetical protein LZ30DRAFT_378252 [Colletotrichum cereale]
MAAPEPLSVPSFATTQLALLSAELAAEVAESSALVSHHAPAVLQRAGLALPNLVVGARRTGLGGRTVLELGADPAVSSDLPEHGLRPGDIVLVSEQPAGNAKKKEVKELESKGARGVVTRVRRETIGVAVDEGKGEEREFAGRVWIVKVADDVTYRRMSQTMEKLEKMTESEYTAFMRVLFGLSSPSPVPQNLAADSELSKIQWIDPSLNDSQKDAIRFALASREVALIHGPPGVNRQNPHTHRADPPADQARPPHPRVRPLKHIRRQHRRAPRAAQDPHPPPRPPGPPAPQRPRPLPRRADADLRGRGHCQGRPRRDGREAGLHQKDPQWPRETPGLRGTQGVAQGVPRARAPLRQQPHPREQGGLGDAARRGRAPAPGSAVRHRHY